MGRISQYGPWMKTADVLWGGWASCCHPRSSGSLPHSFTPSSPLCCPRFSASLPHSLSSSWFHDRPSCLGQDRKKEALAPLWNCLLTSKCIFEYIAKPGAQIPAPVRGFFRVIALGLCLMVLVLMNRYFRKSSADSHEYGICVDSVG